MNHKSWILERVCLQSLSNWKVEFLHIRTWQFLVSHNLLQQDPYFKRVKKHGRKWPCVDQDLIHAHTKAYHHSSHIMRLSGHRLCQVEFDCVKTKHQFLSAVRSSINTDAIRG